MYQVKKYVYNCINLEEKNGASLGKHFVALEIIICNVFKLWMEV